MRLHKARFQATVIRKWLLAEYGNHPRTAQEVQGFMEECIGARDDVEVSAEDLLNLAYAMFLKWREK